MTETTNGTEQMRIDEEEEIRSTREKMLEGGSDSTRQTLRMYRDTLESEGVSDVDTISDDDIIERMVFRNATMPGDVLIEKMAYDNAEKGLYKKG